MNGAIYETKETAPLTVPRWALLIDAERGPSLLGRGPRTVVMATTKTGSFWLTQYVRTNTQGTAAQGVIDIGSLIDIPSQRGLSIEQVDFIVQIYDTVLDTYVNSFTNTMTGGDNIQVDFQLSDQNPGTDLVSADNNSLIASGAILYNEPTNTTSVGTDFFPDEFGSKDESFIVVNDSLYLVAVPIGTMTFTRFKQLFASKRSRLN